MDVKISFEDDNDRDGLRPTTVKLQLYNKENPVSDIVEVNIDEKGIATTKNDRK